MSILRVMPAKIRKPSKPVVPVKLVPVQFRFPRELLELLDIRLAEVQTERPGLGMTRTDLVRDILYSALRSKGQ